MEFSRQEYWSGLPFSPPRDLPDPGIVSCIAGGFFTPKPGRRPTLLINATKYEFSLQLVYDGGPELVGFFEGVTHQLQFEN